ncbi:MAG: cupredoxin domain-containing protein [Actinomycetota bacterium]
MRRILILAVSVFGMSVVTLPAQAKTVTIETKEFKFVPPTASIAAGDTIEFSNTGAAPHDAEAADGAFKIKVLNPGQKESVVVTKSGTIAYVCNLHATVGMKATLTVAAAAGAVAPEPAAAPAPAASASVGPVPSPSGAPEDHADAKEAPAAKAKIAAVPAADKPPSEKYFPALSVLLMLLLAPIVGMSYRKRMKAADAKVPPAPPAPPAESAG